MSGQTNLQEVLKSMKISCDDIKYGFACVEKNVEINPSEVIGTFQEEEGLTVIASIDYLEDRGIGCSEGPYAKLTIDVHTSLELVGLTAVLAKQLGDSGISANVVAAFYHDHIFVQYDLKVKAIEALLGLSRSI